MTDDIELRLRLRLVYLESEHNHVVQCLARLLQHVRLPEGATAKDYSNKEIRTINVPARALATAVRIVRK